MTRESITILIPSYNKGDYIKDTIDSLLRQDEPGWLAIIMDDASTDGTRALLDTYAPLRDPRFSVHLNDTHRGKSACMNRLVDLATTDIVGELDSDDVLAAHCVADVLDAYRVPGRGFVYTNFMFCDAQLTPRDKGFGAAIPEGRTNLELDCISHFRTFRKTAFLQTEGYDESLTSAIDKDMIYKLEEVTTPYFIDREHYFWRMLPRSLSRGPENKALAFENHRLVKARALARRHGDPRAVRLAGR